MAIPNGLIQIASIGSGYFADVLKCRVSESGESVALKRLRDPNNVDHGHRFKREICMAKALANIDGVMPILIDYHTLGLPCYSMPLASRHVADFLRLNPTLSFKERISLFRQTCAVIGKVHQKDHIHRDISPTNVLMRGESVSDGVWVADFGLGKSLEARSAHVNSSVSGYGQAYYVAPEQLDSLKNANEQSDVFSLGRFLDFVITGRQPSVAHWHEFRTIADRATSPEPLDRYKNAVDLLSEFDALSNIILGDDPTGAPNVELLKNVTADADFKQIARIVSQGKYRGHPYAEFIDPVVSFLDKHLELALSKWTLPEQREAFRRLSDVIDECMKTVGWPFNRSSAMVAPFIRGLEISVDEELIRTCFRAGWRMAIFKDQWDAQKRLRSAFKFLESKPQLHSILAAVVFDEGKTSRITDEMIAAAPSGPLRNAMKWAAE